MVLTQMGESEGNIVNEKWESVKFRLWSFGNGRGLRRRLMGTTVL